MTKSWITMRWILLLAWVFAAVPAFAQPKPVTVRIAVIEVTKTGNFDPRIAAFKSKLPGFDGAKLVDELESKVDPGSSVSLQIRDKKQVLKVTVDKVEADGTVKLKVEIEAFKFSMNTTHLRDKATVIVGKMLDDKVTGLYLAVTTRVE